MSSKPKVKFVRVPNSGRPGFHMRPESSEPITPDPAPAVEAPKAVITPKAIEEAQK